jgi:hypothetical protein
LSAFRLSNGVIDWSIDDNTELRQIAVDQATIYFNTVDGPEAVDRRTGTRSFVIADPFSSGGKPPIITAAGKLALPNREGLSLYDLASRAIGPRYPLAVSNIANPAATRGKFYTCGRQQITSGIATANTGIYRVIDESTGVVERSRTFGSIPDTEPCGGKVVATANLSFIGTALGVYALDADANVVWTHRPGGTVVVTPERYVVVLESGFDLIGEGFSSGAKVVVFRDF